MSRWESRGGPGVGGVVSQIGWMSGEKGGVVGERELVMGLVERFNISPESAFNAIQYVIRAGAIREVEGGFQVTPRR